MQGGIFMAMRDARTTRPGLGLAGGWSDVRSAAGIWLPGGRFMDGLAAMGAKYLPTIKDLKANQRFQQKQKPLPQFKKMTDAQVKKSKKK
jgi:hypothetical protein